MDIDECRFSGRLCKTVGSAHSRRFMKCLDIAKIFWKVFEKGFFCRAGISEYRRQPQFPQKVESHFPDGSGCHFVSLKYEKGDKSLFLLHRTGFEVFDE